ncbi:uncharacterized protein LOC115456166 [Manduca sexta]|uniref:uncharacterized protein LOC115456166 n=1 Tax=Manduca sexta TaxID=7130 RepID=UPI00188E1045|nr:uncharacterized protein LOC115456166 [Manduca sexta]
MYLLHIAAALVLTSVSLADNSTLSEESCSAHPYESGPWSCLLEEWATSATPNQRHGRIMALPPAKGYYVSDRIDLVPPPPPQHQLPPHAPHPVQHGNPQRPPTPMGYDEWQPSPPPPGKIVNRPPYKDKFKPSHPAPPNYPIPVHRPTNTVDRLDEQKPKPQKQVSETDLFLLTAIEKLVYRADIMEKRLRKLEESVHYLVAGVDAKPEPCVTNFTRVGSACYQFSSEALNWKGANYACRKLKANMLEIDNDEERKHLLSAMLADKRLQGGDWWTGGLNPGLLWIWSHSAKPAVSNGTVVAGEGRCLAVTLDQSRATLQYHGDDCGLRHRYVCEKGDDDKLSNEIEKKARKMRDLHRKPKIAWSDDPLIV